MKLVFTEWNAGHHCLTPDPIPVTDQAQALLILEAISNAVTQGSNARASLQEDDDTEIERYYMCEDYVAEDWDY